MYCGELAFNSTADWVYGPHVGSFVPVLQSNGSYLMVNDTQFHQGNFVFYGSTFDSTQYNWSITVEFTVTLSNASMIGNAEEGNRFCKIDHKLICFAQI